MKKRTVREILFAYLACVIGLILSTLIVCAAIKIALDNKDLMMNCAKLMLGGGLGACAVSFVILMLCLLVRRSVKGR